MIQGIYSIRDVLVGNYEFWAVDINDDVAERHFKGICKDNKNMPIEDFELYKVGHYDTNKGVVYSEDSPVYICRGERNE